MARLLSLMICSLLLIGADLPTRGYVFHARGASLYAIHTEEALNQAVVEYTSAILDNPRDSGAVADRALVYVDMGKYRLAIHDADTALIHGNDDTYYYVVGRSKPSIECLRRGFTLACARGDRDLISAIGKLLLLYETRYLYVTEEEIYP
jgi:tetratricopeptide (TPR) repeat protein